MGAADVVPGVSGGTMAFILGIYKRLLEAIRSFDGTLVGYLWRRSLSQAVHHIDLGFLVVLVFGIFTAVMFFTRVVSLPHLLQTHPEQVYGLFFGLITASVVLLLRSLERIGLTEVVLLVLGATIGFMVVNMVPVDTPEAPWFIFLSGALAICAMILPGISGSFVLLILNKYAYVFDAIGRFDFAVILPFGLGAFVGLALFSRILVWMLRRFYRQTLIVITGILAGSLWIMWPFQARSYEEIRGKLRLVDSTPVWPADFSGTEFGVVMLMGAGIAIVASLSVLAHKRLSSARLRP